MKRLRIFRETLRTLTPASTRQAVGGRVIVIVPSEPEAGCDGSGDGGGGGGGIPSLGGPSGCVECLTK